MFCGQQTCVKLIVKTSTRVQEHRLCILNNYCSYYVQRYCTAVAGVLHCTCCLAWVVLWSCIIFMHDNEARHAKITAPLDLSVPVTSRTSTSKETWVALDLVWTNSRPSHSWHLSAKGKCFDGAFPEIFWSGKYINTYKHIIDTTNRTTPLHYTAHRVIRWMYAHSCLCTFFKAIRLSSSWNKWMFDKLMTDLIIEGSRVRGED